METSGVRLSDAMGSALDTEVFAEHIQMTLHVGTNVDALGHFAADGHWCHGTPAGVDPSGSGVAHHGIDKLGPTIARAVALDVASWAGVSRLEAGTPVTAAMLRGAASAQGVGVEPGDCRSGADRLGRPLHDRQRPLHFGGAGSRRGCGALSQ